jgi:excisionase family DNA binding protein
MDTVPTTLTLKEAAEWLHMSPAVLCRKARAGLVPAAKPGKHWIFLADDLAAYVRSLYPASRQVPLGCSDKEKNLWLFTNAERLGGFTSSPQTGNEYAKALGLPTDN